MSQYTKEKLWYTYKYEVMWHSQKHYQLIRDKLKENISETELDDFIAAALAITPSSESVINTFDHMWGYFKKTADEKEKAQQTTLKSEYLQGQTTKEDLLRFIRSLAQKYDSTYLLTSSFLKKG
ncbi:YbgA family protein [Staphylococcus simulans]|uniref:YbgA family protein n=1 Tax=Staphylococcus simulans TaxID=1286 RepID=UPI001E60F024|nr:YbgA family protein [Staphylococcus simulans]MCD8915495.1 YbgA family protein [Staphylococcus simulans]